MASTRQVLDRAYRAMAMHLRPDARSIEQRLQSDELLLTLRKLGTDEPGERFIFTVRREEPEDA